MRQPLSSGAVKDVHIVVGILALALNLLAFLLGSVAWLRRRPSRLVLADAA